MSVWCPGCGRGAPGQVEDGQVCRCGAAFAGGALFEAARLDREQWETVQAFLLTRSGGRCEVASAHCIAPGGELAGLWRGQVSIHHRQPRGAGGTSRAGVHSLANLMIICGDGVTGCHGWIEHHRDAAAGRGLLVPRAGGQVTAATDPAAVAVVMAGGRRVLLHPASPVYLPPPDGVPYAL